MHSKTERMVVPLLVAGNGRGARAMLPYIERHNRVSKSTEIVLACVEPAPGKGEAFAALARSRGVEARALESSIERVLDDHDVRDAVVVYSAVDRPGAVRAAVDGARTRSLPAVGYFLLAFPEPTRKLFGIRFVVRPDEAKAHDDLALLLDTLSALVPRGSSRDIFGGGGTMTGNLAEPTIRAGFAEHLTRNAPKVIAGLEPESPSIEIASTERVSRLHVVDHKDAWVSPSVLWADILNQSDVMLRRGSTLVVAEVGPGPGLRLHQATVRAIDGALTFGSPLGEVTRSRLIDLEREHALQTAERQRAAEAVTTSRLSPVDMTD